MIICRIDKENLRTILYAFGNLTKSLEVESHKLTRDLADDYKKFLISNIINQHYASTYPELSEVYLKWKEKQGGQEGFWRLWGDLVNAISVRVTEKGYSVGIEKDAMPSRTSSMFNPKKVTPIWQYAKYGEEGRGSFETMRGRLGPQPARPVFGPSAEEFKVLFVKKRQEGAFNNVTKVWKK
jgi:hypothetical protein